MDEWGIRTGKGRCHSFSPLSLLLVLPAVSLVDLLQQLLHPYLTFNLQPSLAAKP